MKPQGSTCLGTIVENIDCRNVSSSDVENIKKAIWENGMVCIKKQNLTAAEQVEFTEKFGTLVIRPPYYAPQFREPGHPSIIRVGTVGVNGETIPKAQDAELWHKDGSFEQPGQDFILSFLHPKIITKLGGQTGFVDCEDVYNHLGNDIKKELEGATVLETSKSSSFFQDAMEGQHYPDSHHDIFQEHPISKKPVIFLAHRNYEVTLKNGQKVNSTPYVDEFEKHYQIYSHSWEHGDFVIWDNYRVFHKSMGGYGDSQRLFYRTQCRISLDSQQSA